jgi:ACR3 family arsenite efflux pump ArsB
MDINEFFRKNLFGLVLATAILGIFFGWQLPQTAPFLKSLISPVLFLMIFVMIIPMEFKELIAIHRYKKEIGVGIFAILILAPLIAYLINFVIPTEYDFLKAGLILAATMPPGGMIVSWTALLDANIELAMILQTLTFLLAFLTIPLTLFLLFSNSVPFSQSLLIQNLMLYIFLPLIAGFVTQVLLRKKYSKEEIKSWKPTLATISGLCALIIVFISTSLKADAIIRNPQILLWGLLITSVYYTITFLVTLFLSRYLISSYENQMPIVYGTTSKNLSIGLALAISVFSGSIVLGIVFCFLAQMPELSLFYRFVRKNNKKG